MLKPCGTSIITPLRRTGFRKVCSSSDCLMSACSESQLSLDFLAHHQPIKTVLSSFMKWLGDSPLIAHNMRFSLGPFPVSRWLLVTEDPSLRFDIRMLCQELRRWDLPLKNNKVCSSRKLDIHHQFTQHLCCRSFVRCVTFGANTHNLDMPLMTCPSFSVSIR